MYKTLEKSENNIDGQSFRRSGGRRDAMTKSLDDACNKSVELNSVSRASPVPALLNAYFDCDARFDADRLIETRF